MLFGIAAMAWPIDTAIALALALLWGFWALLDSAGAFAQAVDRDTPSPARVLLIVMGLIALVAAFFAIFSPGVAAVTLTWILGIWLIVRGVFELLGAFNASNATPRGLLLASAAVDVLLGILFAANPGRGAVSIAFVLGLVAFVWGVIFLVTGFVVRKQVNTVLA
ncbi:HdeD family acid-resistance protein [Streptomyces sp. NPDC059460]|uniref:HdeD family acid-resistance protein n=1 Tax=Streptomyces sp. NPDC059460 TaxID=3346840 RepID=UPI0036B13FEB